MPDALDDTDVVKFVVKGHIAFVTLNRPHQRNAFDLEQSAATLASRSWCRPERVRRMPELA